MPGKVFRQDRYEDLWFAVDDEGEKYHCAPVCPSGLLLDLIGQVNSTNTDQQAAAFAKFVDTVVLKKDQAKLKKRLNSAENAIGLPVMIEVAEYLIGEYSRRPTQTQSSSANGSSTTGTSTTEPAPSPESTPTNSASTES